jgi:class 3 adenylate cyclase
MNDVHALLLTDIVDSTRLSQNDRRRGDGARVGGPRSCRARPAAGLARREIDKSDGMLALFGSAADAVGYAFAYHHAISALDVPLKARAGLHVGAVQLRENSPADVALGA